MINNMVKVHNRNAWVLVEKFKDQQIKIEPHSYIEMDYDEAIQFRGQYHEMTFDKGGVQRPESYKWIELDKDDVKRIKIQRGGAVERDGQEKYVCHVCAKDFLTKPGLMKHIKAKHLDAMIDSDARDEIIDDEDI